MELNALIFQHLLQAFQQNSFRCHGRSRLQKDGTMLCMRLALPGHALFVLRLLYRREPGKISIPIDAEMLNVDTIFRQEKVRMVGTMILIGGFKGIQRLIFILDAVEEQEVRDLHFLKALHLFIAHGLPIASALLRYGIQIPILFVFPAQRLIICALFHLIEFTQRVRLLNEEIGGDLQIAGEEFKKHFELFRILYDFGLKVVPDKVIQLILYFRSPSTGLRDDIQAKLMERGCLYGDTKPLRDPLCHLLRRLAGERNKQDIFRGNPLYIHQVLDLTGDRQRLVATSTCQNETARLLT